MQICVPITNVYADFPGSVHDLFIFGTRAVITEMDRLHANNISQFSFLGDSGYSPQPYMLTPVLMLLKIHLSIVTLKTTVLFAIQLKGFLVF